MTPQELREQMNKRREEVTALCQFWYSLFPEFSPGANQMGVWLDLHTFERMVDAIKRTAAKNAKLNGAMTLEHAVRFCSKVANVRKTKQDAVESVAA
ncbi:MAG: hypothetical protein JWO71_1717 [Candidatus Acidoferrum typicum]|nr:hypothetical protein [Candidatus Acidoferrum typicum]